MPDNTKKISVSKSLLVLLVILNTIIIKVAYIINSKWYMALIVTIPLLLLITLYYARQKKQKNATANATEDKLECKNFLYLN